MTNILEQGYNQIVRQIAHCRPATIIAAMRAFCFGLYPPQNEWSMKTNRPASPSYGRGLAEALSSNSTREFGMFRRFAVILLLALLPAFAEAGPLSREEAARQTQVFEQLKRSLADAEADADKFAILTGVLGAERDPNSRRRVLELAAAIEGPGREPFFVSVLATDPDAGLRSLAATTLGRVGSEKCLPALAKAAASDPTTAMLLGDIGNRSSARRAATFAMADLAERLPKLADDAAERLRALPDKHDPKDNESLADARLQALYRITREPSLLAAFYDRLKSADPDVRSDGVNAFQFLKLKDSPREVTAALQDSSDEVAATAALVLGRIGDEKTIAALSAVAADMKRSRLVRVNAISALGQMRARPAAELMEKLLEDPEVATLAAIALYRITGKKVAQFPAGYNAD
jgi:HEAT repeat protein